MFIYTPSRHGATFVMFLCSVMFKSHLLTLSAYHLVLVLGFFVALSTEISYLLPLQTMLGCKTKTVH